MMCWHHRVGPQNREVGPVCEKDLVVAIGQLNIWNGRPVFARVGIGMTAYLVAIQ
jgi:hypothetical protein